MGKSKKDEKKEKKVEVEIEKTEDGVDYEERIKNVSEIALPLASKKLNKKVLKLGKMKSDISLCMKTGTAILCC